MIPQTTEELPQTFEGLPQTFEEFLAVSSADIPLATFIFNLLIVAFLSVILAWAYVNYGQALSNRERFSRNFMLLSMTVMIIITVVKSSLALSLGLVGALSIVRYRTAIKEPEELAYTFIAIAIGLGMGANQAPVTISSFAILIILIIARTRFNKVPVSEFVNLRLYGSIAHIDIKKTSDILAQHTTALRLKRFDEESGHIDILYAAVFASLDDMNAAKTSLNDVYPDLNLAYFENIGMI